MGGISEPLWGVVWVGADAQRRAGPVGVQLVRRRQGWVGVDVDDHGTACDSDPIGDEIGHRGSVRVKVGIEQRSSCVFVVAQDGSVAGSGVDRTPPNRIEVFALVGKSLRIDHQAREIVAQYPRWNTGGSGGVLRDDIGVGVGDLVQLCGELVIGHGQ